MSLSGGLLPINKSAKGKDNNGGSRSGGLIPVQARSSGKKTSGFELDELLSDDDDGQYHLHSRPTSAKKQQESPVRKNAGDRLQLGSSGKANQPNKSTSAAVSSSKTIRNETSSFYASDDDDDDEDDGDLASSAEVDLPDDSSPYYKHGQSTSKPPITLPGGRSGLDDAFSYLMEPRAEEAVRGGGGRGKEERESARSIIKSSQNTKSPVFSDTEVAEESSFDPDDLLRMTDEVMSRPSTKAQSFGGRSPELQGRSGVGRPTHDSPVSVRGIAAAVSNSFSPSPRTPVSKELQKAYEDDDSEDDILDVLPPDSRSPSKPISSSQVSSSTPSSSILSPPRTTTSSTTPSGVTVDDNVMVGFTSSILGGSDSTSTVRKRRNIKGGRRNVSNRPTFSIPLDSDSDDVNTGGDTGKSKSLRSKTTVKLAEDYVPTPETDSEAAVSPTKEPSVDQEQPFIQQTTRSAPSMSTASPEPAPIPAPVAESMSISRPFVPSQRLEPNIVSSAPEMSAMLAMIREKDSVIQQQQSQLSQAKTDHMTAVELLRAQLEETHDRIRQVESQLRDAKVELATMESIKKERERLDDVLASARQKEEAAEEAKRMLELKVESLIAQHTSHAQEEEHRTLERLAHQSRLHNQELVLKQQKYEEMMAGIRRSHLEEIEQVKQRAADARSFEALSNQVASTLGSFKALQKQILSIIHDSDAKLEGHLQARERLVTEVESSARKVQAHAEDEGSKLAGMIMAMDGVMNSLRKQNLEERERLRREHDRLQSLQQELASEAKALRENAADERARFAERCSAFEKERKHVEAEQAKRGASLETLRVQLEQERAELNCLQREASRAVEDVERKQTQKERLLSEAKEQLRKEATEFEDHLARSKSIIEEAEEIGRREMERDQLLKDERQRLAAEATRLNKLSAELAVKRAETEEKLRRSESMHAEAIALTSHTEEMRNAIDDRALAIQEQEKRHHRERLSLVSARSDLIKDKAEVLSSERKFRRQVYSNMAHTPYQTSSAAGHRRTSHNYMFASSTAWSDTPLAVTDPEFASILQSQARTMKSLAEHERFVNNFQAVPSVILSP